MSSLLKKRKSKYHDLSEEDHKVLEMLRYIDPESGVRVKPDGSNINYREVHENRILRMKSDGSYEIFC